MVDFSRTYKQLIKRALPPKTLEALKKIRDFPKSIQIGPPAVQMYVNTDEVHTHLGINDFFDFLACNVKSDIALKLEFYNPRGVKIASIKKTHVPGFALHIDVSSLLAENKVSSDSGLVTLQMKPVKGRKQELKRMGQAVSHFYAFYEHIGGPFRGSIGHVHPSSVLDPQNHASGSFVSNQTIFTRDLAGVRLMQANPSMHTTNITHSLIDTESGNIVAAQKTELEPLSTHMIDFDFTKIPHSDMKLTIAIDKLPTSNSKPVLIRKSKNHIWTYSHS